MAKKASRRREPRPLTALPKAKLSEPKPRALAARNRNHPRSALVCTFGIDPLKGRRIAGVPEYARKVGDDHFQGIDLYNGLRGACVAAHGAFLDGDDDDHRACLLRIQEIAVDLLRKSTENPDIVIGWNTSNHDTI